MDSASVPSATGGNPFAPQEPPELIQLEHFDFAGLQLSNIFYGFTIILFFRCMLALLWPQSGRERNYYLAAYTFVLFALGTIFMGMNGYWLGRCFIDNRNFPGGPEAYANAMYSTAVPLATNSTFIIANWLADALMLFRCKVIWQGKAWILILPIVLYLADISMGIMYLYQVSVPFANLFTSEAIDFGLPYFALSTTLNTLLTILISSRLLVHQRRMSKSLSLQSRNTISYMPIVAMLVESSALYAVFSLLFIGTYASGSGAAVVFLPILSQAQIIAPLLIISRVATRKAWTTADSLSAGGQSWSARTGSNGTTELGSMPMGSSPKFSSFHDRNGSGTISATVDVKVM